MDPDNVNRLLEIIDLLDRFRSRMKQMVERTETLSRSVSRSTTRRSKSTSYQDGTHPSSFAPDESQKTFRISASGSEDLVAFGSKELEYVPTTVDVDRTARLTSMMSRGRSMAFVALPSRGIGPRRKSIGVFPGKDFYGGVTRRKSVHFGGRRSDTSSLGSFEPEEELNYQIQKSFSRAMSRSMTAQQRDLQRSTTLTRLSSRLTGEPTKRERRKSTPARPELRFRRTEASSFDDDKIEKGRSKSRLGKKLIDKDSNEDNTSESSSTESRGDDDEVFPPARLAFIEHKLSSGFSDPGEIDNFSKAVGEEKRSEDGKDIAKTGWPQRKTMVVFKETPSSSSSSYLGSQDGYSLEQKQSYDLDQSRQSYEGSSNNNLSSSRSSVLTDDHHKSDVNEEHTDEEYAQLLQDLGEDAVFKMAAVNSEIIQQLFDKVTDYVRTDFGSLLDKLQENFQAQASKHAQAHENLVSALQRTEAQENEIQELNTQLRTLKNYKAEVLEKTAQLQHSLNELEATKAKVEGLQQETEIQKLKATEVKEAHSQELSRLQDLLKNQRTELHVVRDELELTKQAMSESYRIHPSAVKKEKPDLDSSKDISKATQKDMAHDDLVSERMPPFKFNIQESIDIMENLGGSTDVSQAMFEKMERKIRTLEKDIDQKDIIIEAQKATMLSQIEQIDDIKDEAETIQRTLKMEIEQLKMGLTTAKIEIEHMNNELRSIETQYNEALATNKTIGAELSNSLIINEERYGSLQKELELKIHEISILAQQAKQLKTDLEANQSKSEKENLALHEDLKKLRHLEEYYKSNIETLRSERDQLNVTKVKLEEQIINLATQNESIKSMMRNDSNELQKLKNDNIHLAKQNEYLTIDLEKLLKQLHATGDSLDLLKTKKDEDLKQLKQDVTDLQQSLLESRDEFERLQEITNERTKKLEYALIEANSELSRLKDVLLHAETNYNESINIKDGLIRNLEQEVDKYKKLYEDGEQSLYILKEQITAINDKTILRQRLADDECKTLKLQIEELKKEIEVYKAAADIEKVSAFDAKTALARLREETFILVQEFRQASEEMKEDIANRDERYTTLKDTYGELLLKVKDLEDQYIHHMRLLEEQQEKIVNENLLNKNFELALINAEAAQQKLEETIKQQQEAMEEMQKQITTYTHVENLVDLKSSEIASLDKRILELNELLESKAKRFHELEISLLREIDNQKNQLKDVLNENAKLENLVQAFESKREAKDAEMETKILEFEFASQEFKETLATREELITILKTKLCKTENEFEAFKSAQASEQEQQQIRPPVDFTHDVEIARWKLEVQRLVQMYQKLRALTNADKEKLCLENTQLRQRIQTLTLALTALSDKLRQLKAASNVSSCCNGLLSSCCANNQTSSTTTTSSATQQTLPDIKTNPSIYTHYRTHPRSSDATSVRHLSNPTSPSSALPLQKLPSLTSRKSYLTGWLFNNKKTGDVSPQNHHPSIILNPQSPFNKINNTHRISHLSSNTTKATTAAQHEGTLLGENINSFTTASSYHQRVLQPYRATLGALPQFYVK